MSSLVRAEYILKGDLKNIEHVFDALTWRELEILTARLYQEIEYQVELTLGSGDGAGTLLLFERRKDFVKDV